MSARVVRAMEPGIQALRRHWKPFLTLQACAVALGVAYFASPQVQAAATSLESVKREWGVLFAFVAGSFAGGILPEIAKLVTRQIGALDGAWRKRVAITVLYYGLNNVLVLLFYDGLALIYGSDNDLRTVALKVLTDQVVFCCLVSIPLGMLMFDWLNRGLSLKRTRAALDRGWYMRRVAPALPPTWAFWCPILCFLYAMPTDLQYPFSVFGSAAWSLVFVFMAAEQEAC